MNIIKEDKRQSYILAKMEMEQEFEELFKGYPPLLGVEEVMEMLRIGESKAYAVLKSNQFPITKIGRHVRVPKKSFIKYLASMTCVNE